MRSPTLLALSSLALLACGADPELPPTEPVPIGPGQFPPLEVIEGAPAPLAEPPAATVIAAPGAVTAVGAGAGDVIVGSTDGALAIDGETLVALEVWSDEGEPVATGAVAAVARRQSDVLVVGEGGLFHTYAGKLLPSPASDALAELGIGSLAAIGSGETETLWLATASGVYELTEGALVRWSIAGEDGAATALLVLPSEIYAAFGETLYQIDRAERVAFAVPYDFGAIAALSAGTAGSIYVGAAHGLFERALDGAWLQHTLSDAAPAAVTSFAFDPKEGVWTTSSAGLLRVRGGEPPALAAADVPAGPSALDDAGTLWVGGDASLVALAVGAPLAFDADAAPIFESYCMSCHEDGDEGAPPLALTTHETAVAYAQQVTYRISTGQMPPAGADPLTAEALEILLRWYAAGMDP